MEVKTVTERNGLELRHRQKKVGLGLRQSQREVSGVRPRK